MSGVSVGKVFGNPSGDLNVKIGEGEFTFSNEDTYSGGYMIVKDKQFISRQGHGIYVTGDFNKYEAYWEEDRIVGEVQIRHNNGTQYKGTLGADGGMFGFGSYTFRDNCVLEATWDENKPVADANLIDPSGSIWKGECGRKQMTFTAANHFWDEINSPIDDGEHEEEVEQKKENEEEEQ